MTFLPYTVNIYIWVRESIRPLSTGSRPYKAVQSCLMRIQCPYGPTDDWNNWFISWHGDIQQYRVKNNYHTSVVWEHNVDLVIRMR